MYLKYNWFRKKGLFITASRVLRRLGDVSDSQGCPAVSGTISLALSQNDISVLFR